MLIKCPECGKEISDKSKQCIHCGYPLDYKEIEVYEDKLYYIKLISYDKKKSVYVLDAISKMSNKSLAEIRSSMKNIPSILINGLSYQQSNDFARALINLNAKVEIIEDKESKTQNTSFNKISLCDYDKNVVTCPKCGSTSITTGQRGFTLTTGFFGSNKTMNRCANCGYKWSPK